MNREFGAVQPLLPDCITCCVGLDILLHPVIKNIRLAPRPACLYFSQYSEFPGLEVWCCADHRS